MTWLTDLIASGTTELKTRNGQTIKNLTYLEAGSEWHKVVGVIDGEVYSFNVEGRYLLGGETEFDISKPRQRCWHLYDNPLNKGNYAIGLITAEPNKTPGYWFMDEVKISPVEGE